MIFLAIIALIYVLLILLLLMGYSKVPEPSNGNQKPITTFSIVIPFRNEAGTLPHLFKSLGRISYPSELYEIIMVNDASDDVSEEICRKFSQDHPYHRIQVINVVRKTASPKKDAVTTAVEKARYDYILTTDADCKVPVHWLTELDSFIVRTEAMMVAGPVMIHEPEEGKGTNLLRRFQELDFLSLQAATIGGFGLGKPFMCNGANFCYEKKCFFRVNGFSGNGEIASGDDVFLLEKFLDAGIRIRYLKSRQAVVETVPQPTWTGLISQRIRWASKTAAYKRTFGKGVGIIILLMNLTFVVGSFCVISGFLSVKPFFFFTLIKLSVDFILIYRSSLFFRRGKAMRKFIWSSLLYPYFSSYVALASFFTGYNWKGRRFHN